ncbi:PASTA domain-containing protein [Prolixibacteraceae bacterium JC049]|nr:PASTA domain-containing protein [Prolixibacteraceae bacterium JC049]
MAITQREIVVRFAILYVLVVLFGLAVIGKIFMIQNVNTEEWADYSETLEPKEYKIPASRGDIISYDGRVLATSIPSYKVHIDLVAPGVKEVFYKEVGGLADSLSSLFKDKSKWQYKNALKKGYTKKYKVRGKWRQGLRYFPLGNREVTYVELERMKKFPILKRGKYRGGFIIERDDQRFMPHRSLANRTIGALNKGLYDGTLGDIGLTGLEGKCEKYLRGKEGVSIRQNLSGRWIPITEVEPEDGLDVVSTIDVYLQDATENALRKQLQKSEAMYGTAILMEVESGEIRAIANLGLDKKKGKYIENYNYALGHQGCAEPGSTFKLVSLMVAMEHGKVDTSTVYDTGNGVWKYSPKCKPIFDSDWHHGGHGEMTVKQIFEKSSNVGVAKIIVDKYKSNASEFIERVYNFGLNKKLDLGIAGEGIPAIKHPSEKDKWWGTSLAQMSYGYEIKMTPLQTLTFYNAVANNGKMVKPKFVRSVVRQGVEEIRFPTEVLNSSICSKETLGKAKAMLEGVVLRGTGRSMKKAKYTIAGKTGTAQVANKDQGYFHNGKRVYQASFAGYFPVDKPKYSCIVLVMGPKGSYYGGSVAGPVFREIADKVYTTNIERNVKEEELPQYATAIPKVKNGNTMLTSKVLDELKIAGEKDNEPHWAYITTEKEQVAMFPRKMTKGVVPNVIGMGATDAVNLLENMGMKVKMAGYGKVRKQSPKAGARFKKGRTIYIDLG